MDTNTKRSLSILYPEGSKKQEQITAVIESANAKYRKLSGGQGCIGPDVIALVCALFEEKEEAPKSTPKSTSKSTPK